MKYVGIICPYKRFETVVYSLIDNEEDVVYFKASNIFRNKFKTYVWLNITSPDSMRGYHLDELYIDSIMEIDDVTFNSIIRPMCVMADPLVMHGSTKSYFRK